MQNGEGIRCTISVEVFMGKKQQKIVQRKGAREKPYLPFLPTQGLPVETLREAVERGTKSTRVGHRSPSQVHAPAMGLEMVYTDHILEESTTPEQPYTNVFSKSFTALGHFQIIVSFQE